MVRHEIFSSQVHSLGGISLTAAQKRLLAKGLSFIPTPKRSTEQDRRVYIKNTISRVIKRLWFQPSEDRPPLYPKKPGLPTRITGETEDGEDQFLRENKGMSFFEAMANRGPFPLPKAIGYNLARPEREALVELRGNPDITIIPADKNMGVAVLPIGLYEQLMDEELAKVPQTFKQHMIPLGKLWGIRRRQMLEITRLINKTDWKHKEKLMEAISMAFRNGEQKSPQLFGLPKVHKTKLAMRLIVPATVHPMRVTHQFIAKALDPFLLREKYVITHSLEAAEIFLNRGFARDDFYFKADIVAMYPNVHLPHALEIAAGLLGSTEPTNQLTTAEWHVLLKYAHYKLDFQWKGKLWCFANGVPIGAPSGPQISILALHAVIRAKLDNLFRLHILKGYGAYFDDHFGISSMDPAGFLDALIPSAEQPFLRFEKPLESGTLQSLLDSGEPLVLLDIALWPFVGEDHQVHFRTGVYTKPQGAYQYVPWTSAHPPAVKRAIPRGELSRRLRIASTPTLRLETLRDLATKLGKRGYPKETLLEALRGKAPSKMDLLRKIRGRRESARFPWGRDSHEDLLLRWERLGESRITKPVLRSALVVRFDPHTDVMIRQHRRNLEEVLRAHPGLYKQWGDIRLILAYKQGQSLGNLFRRCLALNLKRGERSMAPSGLTSLGNPNTTVTSEDKPPLL